MINNDIQQSYKALINAFIPIYSIKETLTVIKNTMQSGRIILTEDPINNIIEMIFNISLNPINYPPFDINLMIDPNPSHWASVGAETTEKTTYSNPIIQQDPMELEIIEPILKFHYPDGTTENIPLKPIISGT